MSINLLEFASHMTDSLDKAVVRRATVGVFADEGLRAKFIGAKTVLLPELSLSGLGDYDRDSGFATGTVSVTNESCTLSMDRGRSFQLDREDNDETGVANLAGQVLGEFVRTQVVPEMDAYVLSKVAGHALLADQTVSGELPDGAFSMLNEAIEKVQDIVGYEEPVVAFVNSTFWKALQGSTEIAHTLSVNDFDGEMRTQVHSLNGVSILPVPNARMKTAFRFLDGTSSGGTAGGFVPDEIAEEIGFLVCPKRAVALVKKTEQVRAFDPSHNIDADAWKLDYRLYYDAFIRGSMADAVYVYTY